MTRPALALPLCLALVACGDIHHDQSTMGETTGSTDTSAETDAGTDTDADTDTDTGALEPAGPDHAPDPSLLGPYPVGVRTIALTDPSRGDMEPRPIVTEVWYPATDAALDGEGVVYTINDLLRPDAVALLSEPVDASFTTTAVRDAPVRGDDGPYPVVLFSHGSGGVRMQSTYFTVALASHGYVVLAPDHYGNTLSDIIVDGDLTDTALFESLGDRPLDLDFLVDYLETLDVDDPLAGSYDLARLGVSGHSFGALTSVRWMGMGAPVSAVVAQAPPAYDLAWLSLDGSLADFDTPLMLHVGGMDQTTPPSDANSIWVEATPPRARMTLQNAGHFTFSDLCQLDAEAIAEATDLGVIDALGDGCDAVNTPPEVATAVIRYFGIGHFNRYLRDSTPTAALLTQEAGRALGGDEVTYESE